MKGGVKKRYSEEQRKDEGQKRDGGRKEMRGGTEGADIRAPYIDSCSVT